MQMQSHHHRLLNEEEKHQNFIIHCNNLYCSLGGFNEMPDSHDDDEEEEQTVNVEGRDQPTLLTSAASPPPPPPPTAPAPGDHITCGSHLRKLLIDCAESVSRSDWQNGNRIISILSRNASPYGDSTDRLVAQFTRALATRNLWPSSAAARTDYLGSDDQEIERSYLSLNQVTPFIRFAHLTANQAILEALDGVQESVHIVDFNIMQGLQWPPFMQALAERDGGPPGLIRMTGTGFDLETLHKTGRRLEKFAQSLGLRFEFHPMQVQSFGDLDPSCIDIVPGESLAINCVLHLHKLLRGEEEGSSDQSLRPPHHHLQLKSFLEMIKNLEPKVVTLAEREADHNHPVFMDRFTEALNHYSALFDSLEATLPPKSQERLNVEQVWFGREIINIVSCEGSLRTERHQRFEHWMRVMNECGFSSLPLSPFALSQARLLLRLHYPSEGYQLQLLNDSFFLGWQHTPLFFVSSWH